MINSLPDVIKALPGAWVDVKIHGRTVKALPFSFAETWLNESKRGSGYYFILKNDAGKMFLSVDTRTANERLWTERVIGGYGGNKKVVGKGYIYTNERGYLQFAFKNLSCVKCVATTRLSVDGVHFKNERTYTKEELDALITPIEDLDFSN